MIYLRLFWEFFKAGLFAVGGGMATLPFLYDISDRTGWFTHAQLADMVAVSESTPGPIGVNMATYVGFLTGGHVGGMATGILGAAVATLGLITPSIIVILIVSAFLERFRSSRYVSGAFYGLRPASTAMILAALVMVVKATFLPAVGAAFDWRLPALAVVLLVLTNTAGKKLHPIVFILASAVAGAVLGLAG
ncbi:MAG: chromate transporter [Oscillospiraceae bacterium]|nr:chromate transporter [Oscillospiraceae bacterium]